MFLTVCITLFLASNCIFSVSSSRKEEREKFLRSPANEHIVRNVIPCVSALERYYTRRFLTQQCCVDNLTSSHRYNTKYSGKKKKRPDIFFILDWEFTLDLRFQRALENGRKSAKERSPPKHYVDRVISARVFITIDINDQYPFWREPMDIRGPFLEGLKT